MAQRIMPEIDAIERSSMSISLSLPVSPPRGAREGKTSSSSEDNTSSTSASPLTTVFPDSPSRHRPRWMGGTQTVEELLTQAQLSRVDTATLRACLETADSARGCPGWRYHSRRSSAYRRTIYCPKKRARVGDIFSFVHCFEILSDGPEDLFISAGKTPTGVYVDGHLLTRDEGKMGRKEKEEDRDNKRDEGGKASSASAGDRKRSSSSSKAQARERAKINAALAKEKQQIEEERLLKAQYYSLFDSFATDLVTCDQLVSVLRERGVSVDPLDVAACLFCEGVEGIGEEEFVEILMTFHQDYEGDIYVAPGIDVGFLPTRVQFHEPGEHSIVWRGFDAFAALCPSNTIYVQVYE